MREEICALWCMIVDFVYDHYTWNVVCNRALDNSSIRLDCCQKRADGYTPLYDVMREFHPLSDLVNMRLSENEYHLTFTLK